MDSTSPTPTPEDPRRIDVWEDPLRWELADLDAAGARAAERVG